VAIKHVSVCCQMPLKFTNQPIGNHWPRRSLRMCSQTAVWRLRQFFEMYVPWMSSPFSPILFPNSLSSRHFFLNTRSSSALFIITKLHHTNPSWPWTSTYRTTSWFQWHQNPILATNLHTYVLIETTFPKHIFHFYWNLVLPVLFVYNYLHLESIFLCLYLAC